LTNDFEIIVVNDCSTKKIQDSEIELLQSNIQHFQWINIPVNTGKGNAVRTGVQASKGKHIIYTDIDFPYTDDSFQAIYSALNEGFDVVIGHRNQDYYENKMPFSRKLISKFTRLFFLSFLNLPVTDTQCGLKGFNLVGKKLFLQTKINRFLFDMEFLVLCKKTQVKLKTVPVVLKPNIVFAKMSFTTLAKELVNFFKILWLQFSR
jgi:glycosyltransferase involved in cell wall biosynthesis